MQVILHIFDICNAFLFFLRAYSFPARKSVALSDYLESKFDSLPPKSYATLSIIYKQKAAYFTYLHENWMLNVAFKQKLQHISENY